MEIVILHAERPLRLHEMFRRHTILDTCKSNSKMLPPHLHKTAHATRNQINKKLKLNMHPKTTQPNIMIVHLSWNTTYVHMSQLNACSSCPHMLWETTYVHMSPHLQNEDSATSKSAHAACNQINTERPLKMHRRTTQPNTALEHILHVIVHA